MTGFHIAANALQVKEKELKGLIAHWYLAGFLDEGKLKSALSDYFFLDAGKIESLVQVIVKNCPPEERPIQDRALSDINVDAIYQELFPKRQDAALALSFIQFMQQNHFTKLDRKEVSLAEKTAYTEKHEKTIQQLAAEFGMLDAKPLKEPVNFALMMGGRAMTMPLYLQDLKAAFDEGLVQHAMILLGTRKLLDDDRDNPKPDNERIPYDKSFKDYHTYLQATYPGEALTEGLSLQDIFQRIFKMTITEAEASGKFHFVRDTQHSLTFQKQALLAAEKHNWLKSHDKGVVFGIQPYLRNYELQIRNLVEEIKELENVKDLHLEFFARGRSGVQSGHILTQAFAMVLNTQYNQARQYILAETAIQALPVEYLQLTGRDKDKAVKEISESYQKVYGQVSEVAEEHSKEEGLKLK